jgi:hypothetical protein
MLLPAWVAVAGAGLYVANVALGVGVQTRVVSTRRVRWVHHALYFAVFAGAGLAFVSLLPEARALALVPTLAALAVMPRLRGGSRPHGLVGAGGLAGYAVALWR